MSTASLSREAGALRAAAPVVPAPVAPPPARARPAAGPARHRTRRRSSFGADVLSAAVNIAGLCMLVFVTTVAVIGPVRHDRDQRVAHDVLREQLATAVAPVGQTDPDGALLPPGSPVAAIDIPQLDLSEVVLEGTSSRVLMSGPGRRRDTAFPGQVGNAVIMGRADAFGGPFHSISDLRAGQVIRLTTGQGTSAYRVTGVRRAGDPQPAALAAGKGRLTLVTATGDTAYTPTGVLRVDADLVTPPFDSGPSLLTSAALPVSERPMEGDTGAWLSIMLWCQVLVAAALALAWGTSVWGRWQVWTVGFPVLLAVTVALSTQVAALLPNLL